MATDRHTAAPPHIDLKALRRAGRAEFALDLEIEADRLTATALRTPQSVHAAVPVDGAS